LLTLKQTTSGLYTLPLMAGLKIAKDHDGKEFAPLECEQSQVLDAHSGTDVVGLAP